MYVKGGLKTRSAIITDWLTFRVIYFFSFTIITTGILNFTTTSTTTMLRKVSVTLSGEFLTVLFITILRLAGSSRPKATLAN